MRMRRSTTLIVCSALAFVSLGACDDDTTSADSKVVAAKPAADPDRALGLGQDKADALTDWYVDQLGFFSLGDSNKFDIAYPTWFQGHLVGLDAGQTIHFQLTAQADSLVRLYGPSYDSWGSEYLFDRAIARGKTDYQGDLYGVDFEIEVEEGGVYMLVTGPLAVWETTYKFRADCVAGCPADGRCEDDGDCAAGEFCGHNGVVCVTTPCDVSFNICQEVGATGDSCQRDAMCADGLTCVDGGCQAPGAQCNVDDDCLGGWCRCEGDRCFDRQCVPWTKEGESCGGRVAADQVSRCGPDTQCVGKGLAYDLPGRCATTVNVQELLDDPEGFDGAFIATEGHVEAAFAICTLQACDFANACCNSCGADQALYVDASATDQGNGIILSQDGERLKCGGTNCDWQDNCSVSTGSYGLGGRFTLGDYGRMSIEIEDYWGL